MRLSFTRSRHGLRFALLHGFLISCVLIAVAFLACVWTVYQTANQPLAKNFHADAAVVLGAAAWDKRPSPVFRERINHALALYQSHQVDKLIFTGGTPKKGFMTEAEVGRRYALKQGIPAADIYFENTSRNTYYNIQNIKPLLRNHDIDSIVIVSDPYHLARAKAIAEDEGLNVSTSPTPTTLFTDPHSKQRFLLQESYALFLYHCEKIADWILDQI